mmetsp:Transcript_29862/g.58579  ORF Transcript_29862/g.58579 Transcript_29862/m.58579 type:complete len:84 (+) Transcript_29862:823-1074(+)
MAGVETGPLIQLNSESGSSIAWGQRIFRRDRLEQDRERERGNLTKGIRRSLSLAFFALLQVQKPRSLMKDKERVARRNAEREN